MLEPVSDAYANARPQQGGEYLGVCPYCHSVVYSDTPHATRDMADGSSYAVHLACEDEDSQYGDIVDMIAPEIERRTGTDRRTLDQLHDIQRREKARRV
jgi:hypothetical protein